VRRGIKYAVKKVRGEVYGEAKREHYYFICYYLSGVKSPYEGLLPLLHLDIPSGDEEHIIQRMAYLPPVVPKPIADLNES